MNCFYLSGRMFSGASFIVLLMMGHKFVLIRIPKDAEQDVFGLRTEGGKLVIRASDPASAAMGLEDRSFCDFGSVEVLRPDVTLVPSLEFVFTTGSYFFEDGL